MALAYVQYLKKKPIILDKLEEYKVELEHIRLESNFLKTNNRILLDSEVTPKALIKKKNTPSITYDINKKPIGKFLTHRKRFILMEQIPKKFIEILLNIEDHLFYQHSGVHYLAILRAFIQNVLNLRYSQGGSTITQQLAKLMFTDREKTLGRKFFEFLIVFDMEKFYTKDRILEMYINLVYLGHSNYGFETASFFYFNKSLKQTSIGEMLFLVTLLPAPNTYSPLHSLSSALKRFSTLLDVLEKKRLITFEQKKSISNRFYSKWKIQREDDTITSIIGGTSKQLYYQNKKSFVIDYVHKKLTKYFTDKEIETGGFKIYTSFDIDKQVIAKKLLESVINKERKFYNNTSFSKVQPAFENKKPDDILLQGAFLSIDPYTGNILSMVGGYSFSVTNQFNRSLFAFRQVGSLLKPFIYYLAIEKKFLTPASIVEDSPFKKGNTEFHNYDKRYRGAMTVYEALKTSRNIPAIRTLEKIGVSSLRSLLKQVLGWSNSEARKRIPNELGVALGSVSLSPYEIAKLYSALVNGGFTVNKVDILYVTDRNDITIWENEEKYKSGDIGKKQVMDSIAAYTVLRMLQGVFDRGGTVGWVSKSYGEILSSYRPFMAGKTGTSSNYVDAWFVGLLPNEVSVIWLGRDDNSSLGDRKLGGILGAPIWLSYILQSYEANKYINTGTFFIRYPSLFSLTDVVFEDFCSLKGCIPRDRSNCVQVAYQQVFYRGYEPQNLCIVDSNN